MAEKKTNGTDQQQWSDPLFRLMVEESRDGLVITQNGMFKYVNPAFCTMLGYTVEEILGMTGSDLLAPSDKERMLAQHYRRMSGGGGKEIDKTTLVHKEGRYVEIEMSATAIEYEGALASFISTRDITGRNRLEEELIKSEERYRRVIQSLQEGLFVIQDEKFIFVNEAIVSILGYTVEEMVGKTFHTVIPPESGDQVFRRYAERHSGTKGSWSYESLLLHKDGVTRIPVILSTNLTEVDGKPAVVGTAKDITDRVRAEEKIKAAQRRLEEINHRQEQIIEERTKELTEANTQLFRLQKENLQSQFDVLKQQVNPHFLFNSLNVLTSLIRIEPDMAEKFTEHLAKVYRYVLENKDNELVPLSTEMDFLDAYLFLLNIRFMGKLKVRIEIPDDKRTFMIIPLAMQLLIENAIKHNAMSKKSPLVIDIFIDDKENLNVINNLQEREAHMASTGVGLKNIQNRYLLLNNTVPEFEKTATRFIARIPLVAVTERR